MIKLTNSLNDNSQFDWRREALVQHLVLPVIIVVAYLDQVLPGHLEFELAALAEEAGAAEDVCVVECDCWIGKR